MSNILDWFDWLYRLPLWQFLLIHILMFVCVYGVSWFFFIRKTKLSLYRIYIPEEDDDTYL